MVFDWQIWVRVIKNKMIVGFISASYQILIWENYSIKFAIINFLWVNKQLRHNRLTPVLIK